MSIEETNKLRASLGLAPLEVNEGLKIKNEDDEKTKEGGKVVVEDGMEFVHKAAEHIGRKKEEEEVKEKLEVRIFSFLFREKPLRRWFFLDHSISLCFPFQLFFPKLKGLVFECFCELDYYMEIIILGNA